MSGTGNPVPRRMPPDVAIAENLGQDADRVKAVAAFVKAMERVSR